MDIEIKRDYYLGQLIQWQNNGLIKVIIGIRRCGKSFLLRTLFKKYLTANGLMKTISLRWRLICSTILITEIRKSFIRGRWSGSGMRGSIIFCWMKSRCWENL